MVDKQTLFSQLPAAQQELAFQRFHIIQPFLEGRVPLTNIVRTHRLALRTARRWVQRYRADGLAGLVRSVRADRGTLRGMSLEMHQFIQDTDSYEVQFLSKFTEAELEYLQSQRLGRLATVNQRGEPQVAAVGFRYNPELDTIDIGGYDMANTQKFRNIARNGLASFLVDDVLPPWKTRSMEIRGHAQALPDGGQSIGYIEPNMSPALIRITPRRIIFWDATIDPPIGSKRNV